MPPKSSRLRAKKASLGCFVIMPYTVRKHDREDYPDDDHWDRVYDDLIVPAARGAGLDCHREKSHLRSKLITKSIFDHIEASAVVICDLSTGNENVLFEAGWAFRSPKPVVMIRDDRTQIPFNLADQQVLVYFRDLSPKRVRADAAALTETLVNTLAEEGQTNPLAELVGLRLSPGAAELCGIGRFYPRRADLIPARWEELYDAAKSPREVLMMGQSISKAFTNQRQAAAFIKWCQNGTKMRVLFLSPGNAELAQLREVGGGMLSPPLGARDPSEYLKEKIHQAREDLQQHVVNHVAELSKKPLVRFATRDMPFSIMAVDDDMVVTFYGARAEADNQPTIVIRGATTEAYRSFRKEFETIWSHHSSVHPFRDPILAAHKKYWSRYIGLRDLDGQIPPPRQAIVYPTYRCSAACSYCMYRSARSEALPVDMEPDDLMHVLGELYHLGVRCFELSGGGEPLEHGRTEEILAGVAQWRAACADAEVGLLTNGLGIDRHLPVLLDAFNDYVRISRFERSEDPNGAELSKWRANVSLLLAEKRKRPAAATKIGLKYLLTQENQDRFVDIVRDDLADDHLRCVDHLRFRSSRRVDPETITRVEQQLFYALESLRMIEPSDRVSLSLPNLDYPRNFRCWISPMNVVISPEREVYVCCNYLRDPDAKCIGTLEYASFEELWRSPRHREVRKALTGTHCAHQDYCNCRYAEIQLAFEQIALTVGNKHLP